MNTEYNETNKFALKLKRFLTKTNKLQYRWEIEVKKFHVHNFLNKLFP